MRITKLKKINYTRSIVVSVTATVMLAVALVAFSPERTTGNAASLKHIEEIVAQSGTFNILEIVPDEKAASFGYYIAGQEPISSAYFDTYSDGETRLNGWMATLAKTSSPAGRSAFANELFGRLASRGILGNVDTTPLRYTYIDGADYYTEAYLADDPENWKRLPLADTETVDMPGTFTPAADGEDGAFQANYAYVPAIDGTGGYVQNILRFEHSPAHEPGYYYYSPAFTMMDLSVIADEFASDWEKWENVAIYELDGEFGIYTYLATTGEIVSGGGFNSELEYFYVRENETGAPGVDPAVHQYKAIVSMADQDDAPGDGFTTPPMTTDDPSVPGPAYFSRSITGYTYVLTGGNYMFAPDANGNQNTIHFNDIYYKAGFVSNNLFKRYVMGLADPGNNPELRPDYNALNVTVTVKKAGDVKASDVAEAGMIYISSGTDITTGGAETGYASTDISDAAAVAVYNFTANQLPLIIDYSIIQGSTEESPVNRIQKLSLLCLQPGFESTDETSLEALAVDWESLSYIADDVDENFVCNNVYSFSPFNTVSTANNPDISNPGLNDIFRLVSPLFNEAFSQEVLTSGFSGVLKEIKDENFLKQIAGQTDMIPEDVSVAAAVRHIINYKGHRQTNPKTEIRVLELQPAKVAANKQLSAATVCAWIGNTLPEDKISVVHMATGEFIGKIEDINEMYDMIYIGMSTDSFNMKNGKTDYNDSKMDGLIYTGIGDTFNGSIELAGIREQDYSSLPGGIKAIDGTWNSKANQFRFSGNDITETKVTELKKYVQAGYPIILADGFVSGSGIDAYKVDNSSYMYEAVSGIYGVYPNVMTQAFASDENNRDTVIKYLNVSKPTIELTAKPVEYADNSNASITADPSDGYYYLKYVFAIDNVTDPTPVSTRYDCGLFIDLNADGRYSANEKLDDISIRRVSDGSLVLPVKDPVTDREYYKLSADIDYQVTRQMPQEYVGIIPWKLEVVKNGADQIHASVQGFTRIAAGINKQTVKVLQIMQQGTSNTELNLSKQLSSNPKGIYGQLISNLADFNVTIDAIENISLEAKGTTDEIFNYLNEYDMLIIGFNDMYDGIGVNAAAALVRYINSGKSVLFTHDTTSLSQVPSAHYPMKENINPITKTLNDNDVVRNTVTGEYRSVDGVVRVYSYKYIPGGYKYVGDYTGSYYKIYYDPYLYENLYSSEPFLQKTLCTRSIPDGIGDWGYYFNTVIRDAVGLDRYGVTSSISLGGGLELGDLVNVNAPMSGSSISTILDFNRGVAFEPKSGRSKTVNEYQGYTNYALIRFAGSGNTYNYTNNYYKNRETTDVSQVNKGQITTYPYNVNTAAFGGKDGSITGYGGSYMKIGKTHEQYFQINMNTDDIVVWYCMSSGGKDENSYYDDVPNDCVNAYYIYNKGNVTYSGVGHSSAAGLYGPGATQEYVNEAKLFVNTMIAAYQSAVQAPGVAIKQDARGTSDINEKYILTDASSVLTDAFSPTDESRAVYYRISDPNVGVHKTLTVQYYISDDVNGAVDPTVDADRKVSPLGPITTYNANGTEVSDIKGGHVYKLYLMDKLGAVEVLDQLKDNNVFSIRLYVKVTTVIGSTSLTALDSIEIKKQQLFDLT